MAQLAAWRAPARPARCSPRFDPSTPPTWEWGKWLPHQRVDPGAPATGLLLARSPAELEALLERELRPRAGPAAPARRRRPAHAAVLELAAPELIVIVDG